MSARKIARSGPTMVVSRALAGTPEQEAEVGTSDQRL